MVLTLLLVRPAFPQAKRPIQKLGDLKKLSLEQLFDIEVTSVLRKPEPLSQSASAIQVITAQNIRRSGAANLPQALRLSSNLVVAQIDARQWAVSARGFNGTTANKLLVLIDGRTIYTPLYAGVFWDVQDVLMEDIDRIEVISGPGATQWGANAVNGVINITRRKAKDTQGLLLNGGGGTELGFGGIRYGHQLAPNLYYRIYGKFFKREHSVFADGMSAGDNWHNGQGGFRVDWDISEASAFTFQGDGYDGKIGQLDKDDIEVSGGNVLARWLHTFSEYSSLNLQFYYDYTHRDIPLTFAEDLHTYDLDFQHRLRLGRRHDFIWGLGFRVVDDHVGNSQALAFLPPDVSRLWYSGFVQDDIGLIKDRVHLTLGTKIEHTEYTGFELQPSARFAVRFNEDQTVWVAVSRAVRSPSRIDRDFFIPGSPPYTLAGGRDFVSEVLLAYELGYRIQPSERLSLSVATFYHNYDNLRSLERINPAEALPVVISNGLEGESYGAELTGSYQLADWARLQAGYTEMRIRIRPKPGSTDESFGRAESHDPDRQLLLHLSLNLPGQVELNSGFRYLARTSSYEVPAYAELNMRLAWHPSARLEVAIVGQNLLHDHHPEFGAVATRQEIERSLFGKVSWYY